MPFQDDVASFLKQVNFRKVWALRRLRRWRDQFNRLIVCAIGLIFALDLKFRDGDPFLCNVIVAAILTIASLKSLQSADAESNARWLCYWCIFGSLCFLDVIIGSGPLFWLVICLILILFFLQTFGGTELLYTYVPAHLFSRFRRKQKILIEREKRAGQLHEHIRIPADGTGFSYGCLFKQYLDDEVTHIDVEDPYIRLPHQLFKFLQFCELVCQNAMSLKSIALTTGQEETNDGRSQQQSAFEAMTKSLRSRSVSLIIHYSATLHDREIRFNNGWIIKIGRGLDYFKPVPKYSLGYCDLDLRPCHETIVDIFRRHPQTL